MQHTAPQVKIDFSLSLLQYLTAVVGAETAIKALQLTKTRMQESMNEALFVYLCVTSDV